MNLDPDTISAAATALVFGLGVGGKAIHMWLKASNHDNCPIPLSKRTGGAFHISEEGLEKMTALHDELQQEYLRKADHDKDCKIKSLEDEIILNKRLNEVTEESLSFTKKNYKNITELKSQLDRIEKVLEK